MINAELDRRSIKYYHAEIGYAVRRISSAAWRWLPRVIRACGHRSDLPGMRGFCVRAGTAPRLFACLLLGLGIAVPMSGLIATAA